MGRLITPSVVANPARSGSKKLRGTLSLRSVTAMPTTRRPGKAMRTPTGSVGGAT
ncbi:hypothetical protein [Streptomyces rochei]|uniref:hypothetical protein n=1 Tax=Streptomyces rochei TaxID=1928 RepID=UPI0036A101B4